MEKYVVGNYLPITTTFTSPFVVDNEKKKQKKSKRPSPNKMNQIEAIEQIADIMHSSGMKNKSFKDAAPYIEIIRKKHNLSENEAFILSIIVDMTINGCYVTYNDISNYLGCRLISFFKYNDDVESLLKKRYIIFRNSNELKYIKAKEELIKALINNEKYTPVSYKFNNLLDFLYKFDELETQFNRNDSFSYEVFEIEIRQLLEDNADMTFVKELNKVETAWGDILTKMIILEVAMFYCIYNKDCVVISQICRVFSKNQSHLIRRFSESSKLSDFEFITKKIFKYSTQSSGFLDKNYLSFTKEFRNKLFAGENIKIIKKSDSEYSTDAAIVIKPKDIKEKELFYSSSIENRIKELEDLLDERNFKGIVKRMKQDKMRCAFTTIFYGAPGTGKTETALQLAKKTGRAIIQVNISEIRSKWVGESEKNIKEIFDVYRDYYKEMKLAPILLFNEADAIINKRYSGGEQRAVEKMENSLQNIILQEMENLEGIMIATTNFEENFDKAFERRFLFKLKFEKPDAYCRSKIWKLMINSLDENETKILGDAYDFSGGQIENVARKFSIDRILYGDDENRLDKIKLFCNEEKFDSDAFKKQIGFKI